MKARARPKWLIFRTMKYRDKIYGEVDINEPVILDLINCPSMQRLKGISQHGHFEPFFPGTVFSRFEHSLGVFVLLKKFNAPLLEQVAGLLHDVSHTVFSHVADYVFYDGSGVHQNFQDDELENFIEKSELPEILKKHGINWKEVLDESKFPLKEKDLPDLCADRIDYFLREAKNLGKATQAEIDGFLHDFTIIDGFWIFKTKELAKKYALLFLDINNFFWSGLETGVMFKTMGELIKYAIDKKIISYEDLFTTDKQVWEKVRSKAKKDEKLALLVERADNKYVYKSSNKNDYDLHALCKSRVVDPLFLDNEKLKRLSEADKSFAELKREYSKPKEHYIKFLERRQYN